MAGKPDDPQYINAGVEARHKRDLETALECLRSGDLTAFETVATGGVLGQPRDIDQIIAKGDDGTSGWFAAAQLARRMTAAGVSLYHPDPMTALAAAEAAGRPAA